MARSEEGVCLSPRVELLREERDVALGLEAYCELGVGRGGGANISKNFEDLEGLAAVLTRSRPRVDADVVARLTGRPACCIEAGCLTTTKNLSNRSRWASGRVGCESRHTAGPL